MKAADRASRGGAQRETVVLLRDAVELAAELGSTEPAELRARLGIALARIGHWAEARPELAAAADSERVPLARRIQVLVELALVSHWLLDLRSCDGSLGG